MRLSIARLTAILTIGGLAVSSAHADGEVGDLARGASLYSQNCGRCHNPRGPGEFSDAQWPLIVTHMRVIGGLPGSQAREIEAFLRASNNPPPRVLPTRTTGPISGQQLVQAKGCRGCHTIGSSGGTIGPNLNDLFDRRSEEWVRSQIQSPHTHNPKTIMPEFGLTDAEITAIITTLKAESTR